MSSSIREAGHRLMSLVIAMGLGSGALDQQARHVTPASARKTAERQR